MPIYKPFLSLLPVARGIVSNEACKGLYELTSATEACMVKLQVLQ